MILLCFCSPKSEVEVGVKVEYLIGPNLQTGDTSFGFQIQNHQNHGTISKTRQFEFWTLPQNSNETTRARDHSKQVQMDAMHILVPKSVMKTQPLAEVTPVPQSAKRNRSTWSFSPETLEPDSNLKHPIRSVRSVSIDDRSSPIALPPVSPAQETKVPICKRYCFSLN
jgi:hypothetical protein